MAAVPDDGRDARTVAPLELEHGHLPVDHPARVPAEDHAAVPAPLAAVDGLGAPAHAPCRPRRLEPRRRQPARLHHRARDRPRVGDGGGRRLRLHVAAHPHQPGARRRRAVRVVEVHEHRGALRAGHGRDPVAQHVDLRRLDRERVDAGDHRALAARLQHDRGHLEVAGGTLRRLEAADEAHHRQPERRLEADGRCAGGEPAGHPHGRATRWRSM
jgi:hypothetical protein